MRTKQEMDDSLEKNEYSGAVVMGQIRETLLDIRSILIHSVSKDKFPYDSVSETELIDGHIVNSKPH